MNNKMSINIYLSTIESKKPSKQGQRQNRRYGENFDGCHMGGRYRGRGEELRVLRSTDRA